MILAIDCGNTHTVFGTITEEGEIQKIFRMESSRRKTSYEYAAWWCILLSAPNDVT